MLMKNMLTEQAEGKNKKLLIWVGFFIYLLLLSKLTLFKHSAEYLNEVYANYRLYVLKYSIKRAQLIPFKTIVYYFIDEKKPIIAIANVLGNLLMFFPSAVFLHLLYPLRINSLRSQHWPLSFLALALRWYK